MLLVTIPGTSFKLDTGAQASLMRMVAAGMPLQITTAYRDREYQQRLRDLYLAGKGSYALPAGRSLHEQGLAVDFRWSASAWLDFRAAPYGWFRPTGWNASNVATPEWWHWEYRARNDTHKGAIMAGADLQVWGYKNTAVTNKDAYYHLLNADTAAALATWGYKNPASTGGNTDAYAHLRNASMKADTILAAVKGLSTPTINVPALAAEIAKLIPAPTVDYAALAEAVNNDAAKRMQA